MIQTEELLKSLQAKISNQENEKDQWVIEQTNKGKFYSDQTHELYLEVKNCENELSSLENRCLRKMIFRITLEPNFKFKSSFQ